MSWMRRRRKRLRLDERGVSPVIGTVLILVIMIFSIGGILAWGVPAIQGLQDRAQFQHVLTQFLQMDAQVRNLRDPQNTRVITLALAEGQLIFDKGDRWVISATRATAYDNFHIQGFEDDAATNVVIGGVADMTGRTVTLDTVSGGSFSAKSTCVGCTTVSLGVAPNNAVLSRDVIRITIKESGTIVAEAWIFNIGRISYHQSDLNELNRLHFSMGAVFSQQNNAFFVEDTPTVKDPDFSLAPKDTSLFTRVIQLTGTSTSASGDGRRPIVFNLVDNYGASRGRPSFDPATMVRIQVHGALEIPFCNYFLNRDWQPQDASSNVLTSCPSTTGSAGFVSIRYNPGGERMVFDMSHAVVTTTVRSQ